MQRTDVIVVGAGMVGLTAALALAKQGLQVAVIDQQPAPLMPQGSAQLRVSALSLASVHCLQRLNAWQHLQSERVTPYTHMHVWEQDSFASIDFNHQQIGVPQLGHLLENQHLQWALWQQASQQSAIELYAQRTISQLHIGKSEAFVSLDNQQTLSAALVVAADGAESAIRKQAALPQTFWDYEQSALVATVETTLPHQHCARQVFSPDGVLALLPIWHANQCSIVWSTGHDKAESLLNMPEASFTKAITAQFDAKLGHISLCSDRRSFLLKMRYSRTWAAERIVLLGDAAHTIHPLAGQGANLGIMDAASLAQCLGQVHTKGSDIGHLSNLRQYERWRKAEALKMTAAMEGFKQLFSGNHPVKKLVRGLGLGVTNKLPLIKQQIMAHAAGITGDLPELAKPPLS